MWPYVFVGSAVSIWSVLLYNGFQNKMKEIDNMRDMKDRITTLERQMQDIKKQMK
jgi:hypothetical protein